MHCGNFVTLLDVCLNKTEGPIFVAAQQPAQAALNAVWCLSVKLALPVCVVF